ncbi:MAG TPA: F0F1 ATP synthase subunit alpha [Candidatus Acidoferrum sp.]|nr:F0F1 ATP synthase subunit alpha [Candidatus Acidoferrum sp.]
MSIDTKAKEIGSYLRERLESYTGEPMVYQYGIVKSTGDGVVKISGLSHCRYGELVAFEDDIYGMAMDLELGGVGAVLLGGVNEVRVDSRARSTGRVVEVPVGNVMLGRVVDPLGMPLDGAPLHPERSRPIERPAPTIIDRQNVNEPLQTGLLAIDSMIPIGKGQRELIIGDRQTGKSTIAMDCILNQKGKNVICVYVAIGQKISNISRVFEELTRAGAMDYTVMVVATASDSAAMQYIAPYSGCAIAEEFMHAGRDVLIVYDDLSKHAVAYRAMSLLLKRPPGREAYPGDVFYLHSRLLERAAHLSPELGGGSMTALPIVETMASDISAYIPTNVISITDGQIYLESELFHAGIRPAVNVGLSVSRVGGAAQRKAMSKVSKKLRLTLAQYRELMIFAQFGADIDPTTKKLLDYGDRLTETLKQPQHSPLALTDQICLLLAVTGQHLAGIPVKSVRAFNEGLLVYLRSACRAQLGRIEKTGQLSDEDMQAINSAIAEYAKDFKAV